MESVILIQGVLYFPKCHGIGRAKHHELVELYTWRGNLSTKDRENFDTLASDIYLGRKFLLRMPHDNFTRMLRIAHRMRGF